MRDKVVNNGCRPQELALAPYMEQVVTRLTHAIEPNDAEGEPPLLPILNRYESIRSTAHVDFKTTRPCYATVCSHVNQVVADTQQWEQSVAFRLDQLARDNVIKCYGNYSAPCAAGMNGFARKAS